MGYLTTIDVATVRSLLSSLFNRECEVSSVNAALDADAAVRGNFVDDNDNLIALVHSDLAFAAFTGAAIAMLPAGGAEDAVDEGELTEMLEEAYGEVLNVLSRMFNLEGRSHCRYTQMEVAPLEACSIEPTITASFEVKIPGYGAGHLTLLAA